ncbi:Oidioi.mRNA.OKI2018_I69.XSR.g17010.t1.cds [Oikopleura dioica]|uniref:Oidioi.mRNA.OKI2018_I69.XSR.g17010.t1.cds n=1 Tax=Oikopleura dioica TaxID=34765 RepID=A0ABN7SMK5_OIKDI|nr:Oidioi.mRNA.OKI2018_I69.XSR.g17010.t1.cds [Oikopleura dioica]
MEAEDDDPPLVTVENNPAQDPLQLAVRPVVQSQRLPHPPKMMELKFTSRDEVPMISPANFGAVPVPRFSAMTYECMSRSLRQYKQSGIMRKGVGNYCYEFMVPPNELLASAIYE